MAGDVYLPDTSVWVLRGRHESVKRRCDKLLLTGRMATCQMTAMEYLNNVSDLRTYKRLWDSCAKQRWIDVTSQAMDRAIEVHHKLAERGQHRNFRLPDLIIAATAELNGATVLHYDVDYDRIAAITGQATEWVAPRGSLAPRT
ncbi:MAG: PIN domain nuclease [Stackebrandtia sp.]